MPSVSCSVVVVFCCTLILVDVTHILHIAVALVTRKILNLTHWGQVKMADIFQTIFSNGFSPNENCCILIPISLKYVFKGPVNNDAALVQIMAWRWTGDKPLSEPMMVRLPTYICVFRPQWINYICLWDIWPWPCHPFWTHIPVSYCIITIGTCALWKQCQQKQQRQYIFPI